MMPATRQYMQAGKAGCPASQPASQPARRTLELLVAKVLLPRLNLHTLGSRRAATHAAPRLGCNMGNATAQPTEQRSTTHSALSAAVR